MYGKNEGTFCMIINVRKCLLSVWMSSGKEEKKKIVVRPNETV